MDILRRSNKTTLTDNELIIFDGLFDKACHPYFLTRNNFRESFNMLYSHDLRDKDLIINLNKLHSQGLLEISEITKSELQDIDLIETMSNTNITLTPVGGKLWELERNPNWGLYVFASSIDDWLDICSPRLDTAEAFLEAAQKCKMYSYSGNPIYKQQKSMEYIKWKEFDYVHVISILIKKTCAIPDWKIYEQERRWWCSINELLNLEL